MSQLDNTLNTPSQSTKLAPEKGNHDGTSKDADQLYIVYTIVDFQLFTVSFKPYINQLR